LRSSIRYSGSGTGMRLADGIICHPGSGGSTTLSVNDECRGRCGNRINMRFGFRSLWSILLGHEYFTSEKAGPQVMKGAENRAMSPPVGIAWLAKALPAQPQQAQKRQGRCARARARNQTSAAHTQVANWQLTASASRWVARASCISSHTRSLSHPSWRSASPRLRHCTPLESPSLQHGDVTVPAED
jgi:hypothetical protein